MQTLVHPDAKAILDRRFASGEISKAQYLDAIEVLRSTGEVGPTAREQTPPVELGIKLLRKLYAFNDYFSYKSEKFDYQDVYSIVHWPWISSINFLSKGLGHYFHIYLSGGRSIQLGSVVYRLWGLYAYPWLGIRSPLEKAHIVLSDRTFKYRAIRFRRILDSKGKVDLPVSPDTTLCLDGRLLQGNRWLHLSEAHVTESVYFGSRRGFLSTDSYQITVLPNQTAVRPGNPQTTIQFHSYFDRDVIVALLRSVCAG